MVEKKKTWPLPAARTVRRVAAQAIVLRAEEKLAAKERAALQALSVWRRSGAHLPDERNRATDRRRLFLLERLRVAADDVANAREVLIHARRDERTTR